MQAASCLRWEDKKILKNGQTRMRTTESFGRRATGVGLTRQRRYKGVAKNACVMVWFVCGPFPLPQKRTKRQDDRKKTCNRKSYQ